MQTASQITENGFLSDDLQLYYDAAGTGQDMLIICLHGLASNATRWHEFLGQTKLSQSYKLIAPDLRGHGRSMTRREYRRSDWCRDLDNLINAHNLPCIVIGHSLGAQIALEYANQHRDGLAGLILIDPIFPQALTGTLRTVARTRLLIRLFVKILRFLYHLGFYKRRYPARSLYELDRRTREFLKNNPDKSIAELYMNPFADLKYMPLANYLQDLIEVTRPLEPLDQMSTPTLVLLSQGASTSNVEVNRRLLSNIRDCEITPIEADHWLLTEKPVEARQAIEDWCLKHFTSN